MESVKNILSKGGDNMSEIYCECDCIWSGIDNICTNEYVKIGELGCEDYQEEPEPVCPDKYYAFSIDKEKEVPGKIARCWIARMGIKEEWRGREIFTNGYDNDVFTDGRTGILGSKKRLEDKSDDELVNIFIELEAANGISPLYTDSSKWTIKESEESK